MTMTVAVASVQTVPAYPLGRPVDGRPRYGMTPEMAAAYQWLVAHKPHDAEFAVNFRESAWRMARHHGSFHLTVQGLVDRGWIEKSGFLKRGGQSTYRFVHPVMTFKAPRNAA